jgi:hypothetical protein
MEYLIALMVGMVLGALGVAAIGISVPKLGEKAINFLGGKTQVQFDKALESAIALSGSDILDDVIGGGLSVEAASLIDLKASQVDCRRGVISTLEQGGYNVDLIGDDIRFQSKDKKSGEVRGLARCTTSQGDSVSDIQLSIGARGRPTGEDITVIRNRLSKIWGR